ncbi:MAG: hypothetical protein KKC05_01150 [Nanoarchaeota archaeon]|nr:hypothetical protein [Nanoarchaeota archaeon]
MVVIFSLSSSIFAVSSPGGNLTVDPQTVYFNWSHGWINLTSNNNSIQINISNATGATSIVFNYSNVSRYEVNDYTNLTSDVYDLCFDSNVNDPQTMEFAIHNMTNYTNSTEPLSNESVEFYLQPYLVCPPGRYTGNFTVFISDNASENVNITAVIDIPISPLNTYSEAGRTAFFRGRFTTNNDTHTYYMWTNQSPNITSVTINLSGFTTNLDLFLFDNTSTNINSSITIGSTDTESIYAEIPESWQMWSLKLFGNGTSVYVGNLYFSTLNITNIYNNESVTGLNLGTIDARGYNSTQYGIINQDDSILYYVNETFDLYNNRVWKNQNDTQKNYYVLVPNFTQRIEAKITWTTPLGYNVTRWNLSLTNPGKAMLSNSSERYLYANATGAILEEYISYMGPFTTENEGYWNITISNLTNNTMLSTYNLSVRIWMNTSATNWGTTTFNQTTNINYTDSPNGKLNITRNITLPTNNILPGEYVGVLTYYNGSGWHKKLPLEFNVNAGSLVVNNSLRNTTIRINDNVGFNRLGSGVIQKNISVNNTGSYPIFFDTSNNLSYLKHDTSSSAHINYTFILPPNPLPAGANDTLDLNIQINTTNTGNLPGIYRGWILFNTTNSTNTSSSSYPYELFNLTIEVNLSDKLFVRIDGVSSSNGSLVYDGNTDVISNYTNVTFNVSVFLSNGTAISRTGLMRIDNFTTPSMYETNTTEYIVTLGNISVSQASGVLCTSPENYCLVNATVPPNIKGGTYYASLNVEWNTSQLDSTSLSHTLTGTGSNNSLRINNTGIKMTIYESSSLSLAEDGEVGYVTINITNYGPKTTTGTLEMSNWTYATIIAYDEKGGCAAASPNNMFTGVSISGYGQENCWFKWRVTSGTVSEDKVTTSSITFTEATFNTLNISLTVTDTPTSTPTTTSGDETTTGGCSSNSDCDDDEVCTSSSCVALDCDTDTEKASDHACIPLEYSFEITPDVDEINVILGSSNSSDVLVENNGDFAAVIQLFVQPDDAENITSSHTPDGCTLDIGDSCTFEVDLDVSTGAEIGDHNVKYNITPNGESVSFLKTVTLTVHPTEEKKIEINLSYQNYVKIVENISLQIANLERMGMPAENLSKVRLLYNQSVETLDNAKLSIDAGDYIAANDYLTDLQNIIDRINTEMDTLKLDSGVLGVKLAADMWFWVSIIVIIAAVIGLVVYMMLPLQKGFNMKSGYKAKSPKTGGLFSGFKKKFKGREYKKEPEGPKPIIQHAESPVQIKPPHQETLAYGDFYKKVESDYKKPSKLPFSDSLKKVKKKKD